MSGFLSEEGKQVSEPELGIAPMIDVIFQLLLFFILTSTFAKPVIDITLPNLETTDIKRESRDIRIEIAPSGEIAVNNEQTDIENFSPLIMRVIESMPTEETEVIIAADLKVQHGSVLELMSTLGDLGIQRIFFEYSSETDVSE